MTKTLNQLLTKHDNNYGFDPLDALTFESLSTPKNLSVIIPYYNTGEVINLTLKHLYNSLNKVYCQFPAWKFEVIIVDDGSKLRPAAKHLNLNFWNNLKLDILLENLGRTSARNKGLKMAENELCLFMDSDILIDTQLIANHLKVHQFNKKLNQNKSITVSFFDFRSESEKDKIPEEIKPYNLSLNDYRLSCTYGETWWGCEEDKQYINQSFSIVKETNNFRNWKHKYKAWVLPNMILGGFFIVDREDSLSVTGFNESFKGYGFTETSLPTKLIAKYNHYVIPVLIGGGVHIEDEQINLKQAQKDIIFRQKHNFYFNHFLNLTLDYVLRDQISQ